jgi:hypothetical protein
MPEEKENKPLTKTAIRKFHTCRRAEQDLAARFPVEFRGCYVEWEEGQAIRIAAEDPHLAPEDVCIEFLNAWKRGYDHGREIDNIVMGLTS